jgi:signal transduction histidine kinase
MKFFSKSKIEQTGQNESAEEKKEKKHTLLLVDDEAANLRFLKGLLEEDYNILTASDGLEAMELVMSHPEPEKIDLIITDQRMPRMTGVEFLKETINKIPNTIRMILTGFTDIEAIIGAINESKVYKYMTKPLEPKDLKITVQRALEAYELEKSNIALVIAKQQAEKATEEKSNFLSTMSHELRTPLNAVIGMTYLLMQESPTPEQLENLRVLKFSADNLLVLINDLLDFSKIEAGKINFEDLDFSLGNLFNSIRLALKPLADDKNIEIIVKTDEQMPDLVVGDPVRISQILTNLINNAVKFTSQGYVKAETTIKETGEDTLMIAFAVSDTGIGIPADKIDHVFEAFAQASADTTRKYGGTGLGLAITKKLIELQGSKIKLESELGKGSTFSFDLPFKKSKNAGKGLADKNNIEDFKSLKGVKLLLAEDNKVNQMIAQKFLKKWDVEVDTADNGLIALDKLKECKYDLILMDIQMPEMDGYEATEAIRKLETDYSKVPVLALTASTMADVQDKIFSVGMNDFVTKPFNPSDLYMKIVKYSKWSE